MSRCQRQFDAVLPGCRALLLFCSVVVSLQVAVAGAAAAPLFRPVVADPPGGGVTIPGRAAVVRCQAVGLETGVLFDAGAGRSVDIEFNFFPDVSLAGTVRQRIVRGAESFTLIGTTSNGEFMVTMESGACVGHVRLDDGRHFEITFLAEGQQAVAELDDSKMVTEAEPIVPPQPGGAAAAPDVVPVPADAGDIIKVLIVYTSAAQTAVGGASAMQALINQCIDDANSAYSNSSITVRLALAGQSVVTYSETSLSTALSNLSGTSDGNMDSVHTLRNSYGADLVCLLVHIPGDSNAGIGYLMTTLTTNFASSAFCAVEQQYAVANHTFAHELGHNMGCHHAVSDGATQGSGLYSYSHGWHFTGTNSVAYRTVMAYSPGTRVTQFSNPNVSYRGTATGTSDANNALTINNSAYTVANFRQGGSSSSTSSSAVPALGGLGLLVLGVLVALCAGLRFANRVPATR